MRMARPITISILLVFYAFLSNIVLAKDAPGNATVTTCKELRKALQDERVGVVVVKGDISCTQDNWPAPLVLQRNVQVTGVEQQSTSKGVSDRQTRGSIDLSSIGVAVVVRRGAILSFVDVIVFAKTIDTTILPVPPLQSGKGAGVILAGVVWSVNSCAKSADYYVKDLESTTRPTFFGGEQVIRVHGEDSVRVVDVMRMTTDSLWQGCNLLMICNRLTIPDAQSLFKTDTLRADCETLPLNV